MVVTRAWRNADAPTRGGTPRFRAWTGVPPRQAAMVRQVGHALFKLDVAARSVLYSIRTEYAQ
jgi:hypothetical protein